MMNPPIITRSPVCTLLRDEMLSSRGVPLKGLKVAVTNRAAVSVTSQVAVPVQPLPLPST